MLDYENLPESPAMLKNPTEEKFGLRVKRYPSDIDEIDKIAERCSVSEYLKIREKVQKECNINPCPPPKGAL